MAFVFGRGPSFTVGEGKSPTYENADVMWKKRAKIGSLATKIKRSVKGNSATAKKIEKFLNKVNEVLKDEGELNESKSLLMELIKQSNLQYSPSIISGTDFEVWVDNIFQIAITGQNQGKRFQVGDRQDTTVGVYGKLQGIKFRGAAGFRGDAGRDLITRYAQQYSSSKELAKSLESDIKAQVEEDFNIATYYIKEGVNGFKDLYIYSALVQGKTDINTEIQIDQRLNKEFDGIPELLANHTFSLKNYQEISSVHIGDAKGNRAFYGFYYFSTRDSRVSNAHRFVFSSLNSSSANVRTSYLPWAEALYELAGLGQVQFQFNDTKIVDLHLVDYLIVQFRNSGVIKVYSVKDFLQGLPQSPPAWYSNGSIKQSFFSSSI